MKKVLKWTLIIAGTGALVYIGLLICALWTFSFDDGGKLYSTQDLVDNYDQHSQQIADLKAYINKITPSGKSVDIEFDGDKRLYIFHVSKNGAYGSNWNLKMNSKKVDTLLIELGWTRQTLATIKEKLDAANCISVRSGEPCNIGYQRSGMGKYYYNIFDEAIPKDMKKKYNDSCTYILCNEKVVLEYGGGVLGVQCFPVNN